VRLAAGRRPHPLIAKGLSHVLLHFCWVRRYGVVNQANAGVTNTGYVE
jgi:hypothetical protein